MVNVLKENNLQARVPYPEKMSFKNKGERGTWLAQPRKP